MSHFDNFWEAYPKKVARKQCETKWKQKQLDSKSHEVLADVEWRKKYSKKWRDGYIPNPHTYLHQERWDDERDDVRDLIKANELAPARESFKDDEWKGDKWDKVANFCFLEVVQRAHGLPDGLIPRLIAVKNEMLANVRLDPDSFNAAEVAMHLKANWRRAYQEFVCNDPA